MEAEPRPRKPRVGKARPLRRAESQGPHRTERTKCALQANGTWTGQSRGVSLVPGKGSRSVKKIHRNRGHTRSNPPLGRRWTAHPRRRRSTKPKPTTQNRSTQTPAVQTVMGHSERYEKLRCRRTVGTLLRHCRLVDKGRREGRQGQQRRDRQAVFRW